MNDGEVEDIHEVYADNGHRLWGSSVAVVYRNTMLVGTIHHKLIACNIQNLYV